MKKKLELTPAELKVMALELNLKTLAAQFELMDRHMEKLFEVYYHVFPDRLAQDMKFSDQLKQLTKHKPRKGSPS